MSIFDAYQSELKTLNELIVTSTKDYPKQGGARRSGQKSGQRSGQRAGSKSGKMGITCSPSHGGHLTRATSADGPPTVS